MHGGSLATLNHDVRFHKYDEDGNQVPILKDVSEPIEDEYLDEEELLLKNFLEIGLAGQVYPIIENPFSDDFKWDEEKGLPQF